MRSLAPSGAAPPPRPPNHDLEPRSGAGKSAQRKCMGMCHVCKSQSAVASADNAPTSDRAAPRKCQEAAPHCPACHPTQEQPPHVTQGSATATHSHRRRGRCRRMYRLQRQNCGLPGGGGGIALLVAHRALRRLERHMVAPSPVVEGHDVAAPTCGGAGVGHGRARLSNSNCIVSRDAARDGCSTQRNARLPGPRHHQFPCVTLSANRCKANLLSLGLANDANGPSYTATTHRSGRCSGSGPRPARPPPAAAPCRA